VAADPDSETGAASSESAARAAPTTRPAPPTAAKTSTRLPDRDNRCRRLRYRRTGPFISLGALSRDRLQLFELDARREPLSLARIEPARAELDDGRRSATDRLPERVVERRRVEARREEAGEENVSCADRRDWLDARDRGAETTKRLLLAEEPKARCLLGDQDVAGAEVGDRVERDEKVLVVLELLAHEALRLALIR
jgi:hypothetical protein